MKPFVALIGFWFFSVMGFSQDLVWVYFDEKPAFTDENIEQAFSPQGIQRRLTQNIPFTQEDLRVKPEYLKGLKEIKGLELKSTSKWFNAALIEITSNDVLNLVSNLPFVVDFRKIPKANSNLKRQDNKLKLETSQSTFFDATQYGGGQPQLELYNLLPLHQEGFKGSDIRIGVFDAGFFGVESMACFDSLWNKNRILGTYDIVDGDDSLFEKHTHGTYVLSCISANLPNTLIGAAPDALVYLFRTEDGSSETLAEEFYWVKAAEMADSLGIHIINSSLGYTVFDDSTQNHTYADMDGNTTPITIGADKAASKGILVVSSAGNSGLGGWKHISAPADGDSVLTVGAVNDQGASAGFSSYGPSYDGRVKPNVCAVGEGSAVYSFNDDVIYLNGTSFSSPLLAGAAAALWSKYPTASNMEILKSIEESGDRYLNPDDRCGYGIPNFQKASQTLSVKYPVVKKGELIIYPNPVNSYLSVQFRANDAQVGTLTLVDFLGRVVWENEHSILKGLNTLNLTLPAIRNGVYFLQLNLENGNLLQKKLVVTKN